MVAGRRRCPWCRRQWGGKAGGTAWSGADADLECSAASQRRGQASKEPKDQKEADKVKKVLTESIQSRPGCLKPAGRQVEWENQKLQKEVMPACAAVSSLSYDQWVTDQWRRSSTPDKTQFMFFKGHFSFLYRMNHIEARKTGTRAGKRWGGLDDNGGLDMGRRKGLELRFGDRSNRTMEGLRCAGGQKGEITLPLH